MVAIYIVARIWRDMEDRFLPSLVREKEIQNKNQNAPDVLTDCLNLLPP